MVPVIFLGLGDFKPHEVCWGVTVSVWLGSALQAACAKLVMVHSLELLPAPSACSGSVSRAWDMTPWASLGLEESMGPAPPALPHCWVRGGCHRSCSSSGVQTLLPWSPPPSEGLPQDIVSSTCPLHCQYLTACKTRTCCTYLFETHSLLREHQSKIDIGNVCIVTPSQRGEQHKGSGCLSVMWITEITCNTRVTRPPL